MSAGQIAIAGVKGEHRVETYLEAAEYLLEQMDAAPDVDGHSIDLADAWWAWHDAGLGRDPVRVFASMEEAEAACAAWIADGADAGPDAAWVADWLLSELRRAYCTGCERVQAMDEMHHLDHADNLSGSTWHCDECRAVCDAA